MLKRDFPALRCTCNGIFPEIHSWWNFAQFLELSSQQCISKLEKASYEQGFISSFSLSRSLSLQFGSFWRGWWQMRTCWLHYQVFALLRLGSNSPFIESSKPQLSHSTRDDVKDWAHLLHSSLWALSMQKDRGEREKENEAKRVAGNYKKAK